MATANPTPGRFLCGCVPADKEHYNVTRKDDLGNVLCPEHGEPMYGFLSPQREQPGLGRVLDHSAKGRGATLDLDFKSVKDQRDNRSPEKAHFERQREKAMARNGHS